MSKRSAKDGVGQLTLQIAFPQGEDRDRAGGTEGDGPVASGVSSSTGSRPEPKRKWYSLIDKVYAPANLRRAWAAVEANKGAAGIDGMTIRKFAEDADRRLEELAADMRAKTYRPQPVRRVYIPKDGGGERPLGIPTVRDRIVQQALKQVLEPIFEEKFSSRSHGFRPGRGCATALQVVDRAVKFGYEWVVDADIQSFFDAVDQVKLVDAAAEEIADGSVLRLIGRILAAGVVETGTAEVEPTDLGTPQGGPTSPLFANIYLHALDVKMVERRCGLVRYADDFVIFARSEDEAYAALGLARGVLEGELGLRMHPEKTRVVSIDEGFEFLGYYYVRDPRTGMRKVVRRKSALRFREAIRKRTPRLRSQTRFKARHATIERFGKNARLRETIDRVNDYLRGWHWYFKAVWTPYRRPFKKYDQFVRRRMRSAITGRSRTMLWNRRIDNEMLRRLGLVSLEALQQEYLGYRLSAPARKG